jgi:hypothetical protein
MTSSASMIQSRITPRLAWRLCCGAGLLIVLLVIVSAQQPAPVPCGGLQPTYAPIVAFELARTEADLSALFGELGDPCRATLIQRVDAINWVDVLVFIPIYGAFLALFFLGMRERHERFAGVGLKLVLVAVVTDYLENLCLMQLTPQLDASSVWLKLLPWATGAKWLALGAAAGVAGLIYASVKPRKWLVVGVPLAVICLLVFAVAVITQINPAKYGPMLSPAIGISWLIFLITAAIGAVKKP